VPVVAKLERNAHIGRGRSPAAHSRVARCRWAVRPGAQGPDLRRWRSNRGPRPHGGRGRSGRRGARRTETVGRWKRWKVTRAGWRRRRRVLRAGLEVEGAPSRGGSIRVGARGWLARPCRRLHSRTDLHG
jgi:hypothetical protein